jgi:hypothetical protein
MNDFVRGLFAARTSAEVMSNPSPKGFSAGSLLLNGLFVVDSVHGYARIEETADPWL